MKVETEAAEKRKQYRSQRHSATRLQLIPSIQSRQALAPVNLEQYLHEDDESPAQVFGLGLAPVSRPSWKRYSVT